MQSDGKSWAEMMRRGNRNEDNKELYIRRRLGQAVGWGPYSLNVPVVVFTRSPVPNRLSGTWGPNQESSKMSGR